MTVAFQQNGRGEEEKLEVRRPAPRDPKELWAEVVRLDEKSAAVLKNFVLNLERTFQARYGWLDEALLPKEDKVMLLSFFRHSINNVGNPDGFCRYGVSTRGFEMKLLNTIFTRLNLRPYGVRYGSPDKEKALYSTPGNPDPTMSFGYYTLGPKESALWSLQAAKGRFPSRTLGVCQVGNTTTQLTCAARLLNLEVVLTASYAEMMEMLLSREDSSTRAWCVHVQAPSICPHPGTPGAVWTVDGLRSYIKQLREELTVPVFVHLSAECIDDVARLSQGSNLLLSGAPKFFAFPPIPHDPCFDADQHLYVDTISIAKTGFSLRSGLLISTVETQHCFAKTDISYISGQDSTVVGSSNGDFLLFDHYFYTRFPIDVASDFLRLRGREKDILRYIKERELSSFERSAYKSFNLYLDGFKWSAMGYPVNMLWEDEELWGMYEVMLKEKLLLNLGDVRMARIPPSQPGSPPIPPAPDPAVTDRFSAEVTDFYLREVFFPNHSDSFRDEYTGVVTTGGTEGCYVGFFLAARSLSGNGRPTYLYSTEEAHYSVRKAAGIFGLQFVAVEAEEPSGNMNIADLKFKIRAHGVGSNVVISANLSSTVKGGTDSLSGITRVLEELAVPQDKRWLHCDCAAQGNYYPFLEEAEVILPFMRPESDPQTVLIHSISVSGHKMLGAPFPCGFAAFRKGSESYFTEGEPSIVSGGKNGYQAVTIWKRIKEMRYEGLRAVARNCKIITDYALERLKTAAEVTGVHPIRNDPCNIIVLRPPPSAFVLNKYGLPVAQGLSHIVIMPHISTATIDSLVTDLEQYPAFQCNGVGNAES